MKIIIAVLLIAALPVNAVFAGTVNLLTDIKVVYLYEQPDNIDWALIYYLGMDNGCHIDLATIKSGPVYKQLLNESDEYDLRIQRFFIPDTSRFYLNAISDDLFGDYLPDIVILGATFERSEMLTFENYLLQQDPDSVGINIIKKFYRRVTKGDENSIYLKAKQFYENYYPEIEKMSRSVSSQPPYVDAADIYTVYNLIESRIFIGSELSTFLNGIERFKFERIISSQIKSAVKQTALKMNRDKYVRYLDEAIAQRGRDRLNSLLAAREELKKIREIYYYQMGIVDTVSPVANYIEETLSKLSSAIFHEAGIKHNAQTVIRETPEGRKLKFRSELNNDGLLTVKGGWLEFKPYWSEKAIVIDSNLVDVLPNNSLIREYTIQIDPEKLETLTAESLEFIGRVKYEDAEVDFEYRASSYEQMSFSVEFVPDFLILQPFKGNQVDRMVKQASLKAIIRKPFNYSGTVDIEVTTPQYILAGAYEKSINLESGARAIEVKIPLVATKSMGMQRYEISISVSFEGRTLASDIAYVRQSTFAVPSEKLVALLPDDAGLLEDIFISTGSNYKIISDRFLKAGDFGLYDIVLFGSGCFKNYESLELAYDKIKKYLEYGGKVIIFGQPDEWRDDLLPISLISTARSVAESELIVKDQNHTLLNRKNKIDISELLKSASGNYVSYPAIVFPGEKIIEADNNTVLLSMSKIGKGRLIYCGIPLLELVENLNGEAIDFLSNLINF